MLTTFGSRHAASLVAVYVLLTAVCEFILGLLTVTNHRAADIVFGFQGLTVGLYLAVYFGNNLLRIASAFLLFAGTKRGSARYTAAFVLVFAFALAMNLVLLSILVKSIIDYRLAADSKKAGVAKNFGLLHDDDDDDDDYGPNAAANAQISNHVKPVMPTHPVLSDLEGTRLKVQRALQNGKWRVHALNLFVLSFMDILCLFCVVCYLCRLCARLARPPSVTEFDMFGEEIPDTDAAPNNSVLYKPLNPSRPIGGGGTACAVIVAQSRHGPRLSI